MKKLITLSLLIGACSIFGAAADEMRPIKAQQDIARFAGKIVMYTNDKGYFTNGQDDYFQGPAKVGHIGDRRIAWGKYYVYDMTCLLKKDAQDVAYGLLLPILERENLEMREVTSGECEKILKILDAGHAKFVWMDEAKELLKKRIAAAQSEASSSSNGNHASSSLPSSAEGFFSSGKIPSSCKK